DERKAAEAKRADDERKAAEAKRADDERKAAEAKRADDERKAAEAKRADDERKAADLRSRAKKKLDQKRIKQQDNERNNEKSRPLPKKNNPPPKPSVHNTKNPQSKSRSTGSCFMFNGSRFCE
ncbi:hypothetical protein ACLBX8_31180, partial [Methylobacterium sp. D48H]